MATHAIYLWPTSWITNADRRAQCVDLVIETGHRLRKALVEDRTLLRKIEQCPKLRANGLINATMYLPCRAQHAGHRPTRTGRQRLVGVASKFPSHLFQALRLVLKMALRLVVQGAQPLPFPRREDLKGATGLGSCVSPLSGLEMALFSAA